MNPKYSRLAERLRELIAEGEQVARLEHPSEFVGPYIQDKVPLHAWLVKADNILRTAFGDDSAHFGHFQKLTEGHVEYAYKVNRIIGILVGGLSDIEGGFLVHQEALIAGVVLDSVLEQAEELLKSGFKDASAILCRVVLEDALRRLAREQKLPDAAKAAWLNDSLRDKGRYNKPQWRLLQSWLDIGNSAAHGRFEDYKETDVSEMMRGIGRFVAEELR